jgi:hypothetical protein
MFDRAPKKVRVGVVLALLITLGVVAVILTSQSTDATDTTVATDISTEPLAPKFAVLEPATPAAMGAISEEAKMRLDYMASHPDLPDPGPVSEIGVVKGSSEGEITVATVGGAICAFLARGIGGCDDVQRVTAGQAFGAEPVQCEGYRVLGVVPDGVSSIAIDYGDDSTVDATLPVIDNVYVGVLEPVLTVATGLDESGDPRFTLELPLSYYASTQRTTSGADC